MDGNTSRDTDDYQRGIMKGLTLSGYESKAISEITGFTV